MAERKYLYERVLQQHASGMWNDVEFFDIHNSTVKERRQCMKEYRENMPQHAYRFISRRTLKNAIS